MRLAAAAAAFSLLILPQPSPAQQPHSILQLTDPTFAGCTVTNIGCWAEGMKDPHARTVPDPGDSSKKIPLMLRSIPYGTSCDVCDGALNQCDTPPNAAGGHWPGVAPSPKCEPDKMSIEYCTTICMHWFGREAPGAPLKHDVVYAGAQFGLQCFCMPAQFPATGVDVAQSTNTKGNCDVPCKADPSKTCGGGWHNTVIKIDCSTAWGWSFVLGFALLAGLYTGGGVAINRGRVGTAGVGQHWTQLLPNRRVWVELRSLVQDGVSFTRARLQGGVSVGGGKGGASTLRLIERPIDGGSGKGGGGNSKSGSSKKTKKTKTNKGASASTRRSSGSSNDGGQDDNVVVASAPPIREWAPTRTGHLAAGAREVRCSPLLTHSISVAPCTYLLLLS